MRICRSDGMQLFTYECLHNPLKRTYGNLQSLSHYRGCLLTVGVLELRGMRVLQIVEGGEGHEHQGHPCRRYWVKAQSGKWVHQNLCVCVCVKCATLAMSFGQYM